MARKKTRAKAGKKPQQGRFLRVRTAGIRILNRCAFVVLVLLGCTAVALLSVPQVKELHRLESELAFVENEEARARGRLDHKTREHDAIRENPEYLEIIARDRLDRCREGETVIRIARDESL